MLRGEAFSSKILVESAAHAPVAGLLELWQVLELSETGSNDRYVVGSSHCALPGSLHRWGQ